MSFSGGCTYLVVRKITARSRVGKLRRIRFAWKHGERGRKEREKETARARTRERERERLSTPAHVHVPFYILIIIG